jgi:hypothetical protein
MGKLNLNRYFASCATLALFLVLVPLFAATPNSPQTLCIDNVCSPAVAPVVPSAGAGGKAVKWHPGTYVWFSPGQVNGVPGYRLDLPTQRAQLLSFIDSICSETTIKGIQIVALQRTLEGDSPGDYSAGFAAVDAILARLTPCGKRLMMSVQTVWFGNYANIYDIFPRYIVDQAQYGWTKGSPANLQTMRTWQPASADRVIALAKAYGARYNTHPNFEMITLGETSLQVTSDGFSIGANLEQTKRLVAAGRAAFPKTGLRVGVNDMGSLSNLADLMQFCKTYYCALGGPDVWPGDITDADAVFVGKTKTGVGQSGNGADIYEDLRDKLPWAVEVQWQSYSCVNRDVLPCTSSNPIRWSLQQLWDVMNTGYSPANGDFRMPSMKTRYSIWMVNDVNGSSANQWLTGQLPFLRAHPPTVSACPTLYPSCDTSS